MEFSKQNQSAENNRKSDTLQYFNAPIPWNFSKALKQNRKNTINAFEKQS